MKGYFCSVESGIVFRNVTSSSYLYEHTYY